MTTSVSRTAAATITPTANLLDRPVSSDGGESSLWTSSVGCACLTTCLQKHSYYTPLTQLVLHLQ